MTTLGLGEEICDAVEAKLKAKLPDRITAINARKSDGISLAAPRDQDYFEVGIESLPQAPAIVVSEGKTDFEPGGTHSLMTATEILVYVLESDASRVILGKKLQRQAVAITEAIWDDDPKEKVTLAVGTNYRISPVRTIPGAVFDPESDDNWRGFYVVVFKAETLEE